MRLRKDRIKKFFSSADAEMLLVRDENVNYFIESKTDLSGNWLLLTERKAKLFCSALFPLKTKAKGIEIIKLKSRKELLAYIKTEKKVAINYDTITLTLRKKLKLKRTINAANSLAEMRAIKDKQELRNIKTSQRFAERLINKVPSLVDKKMSEAELKALLEFEARKKRIETAFDFIVANAENAAIPHAIPRLKKIKHGFLLIDLGLKINNYCSDISRTFFFGKASAKEKELYKRVFELKEFAEEKIAIGKKAKEIFKEVNEKEKKLLKQELKHGLGHGIGLRVHDYPVGFLEESEDILKEGNVLTVEPGYYSKKAGIRIEDVVTLTKKGLKRFSNAPNELIEI